MSSTPPQPITKPRHGRWLLLSGLALGLPALMWSYDALGYRQASRFENEHAGDPALVLASWQGFRAWHPTRHLLGIDSRAIEEQRLHDIDRKVHERQRDLRLAELRRLAADLDADPEANWQRFLAFRAEFPAMDISSDLQQLRREMKTRRDREMENRAQVAFEEIVSSEQRGTELPVLLVQADRFLASYPESSPVAEVRRRREALTLRLEERDIDLARGYSAREPLEFGKRKDLYQSYLDKHPNGTFASEARSALESIDLDWDKRDFRAVRDRYQENPGDVVELASRSRSYLAAHPQGRFAEHAQLLLRWSERVTTRNEYKVTLKGGHFDKSIAHFFSRGPDLSVELVVNGVHHGPSNIVVNKYDPEWYYEFPRPIRWKLGDPVHIIVTDHDWKDRVVLHIATEASDLLAIRWLCGETWSGKNNVVFECDFTMPVLPPVE